MATTTLMRIGREQRPVVVIDDLAPDPDRLRRYAAEAGFGPARHQYPGVRAALPDWYWPDARDAVAEAFAMIVGRNADVAVIDASYSIVTTPRSSLTVGQRLPHCDAHAAEQIALVHFLTAADEGGGTAFYRHRSTGFETIDARRRAVFDGQLDAELRYGGPPPAEFIGADDRRFERIAIVEARYNRALLYLGMSLHSGAIPSGASLSPDPVHGRLTITGFLAAAG